LFCCHQHQTHFSCYVFYALHFPYLHNYSAFRQAGGTGAALRVKRIVTQSHATTFSALDARWCCPRMLEKRERQRPAAICLAVFDNDCFSQSPCSRRAHLPPCLKSEEPGSLSSRSAQPPAKRVALTIGVRARLFAGHGSKPRGRQIPWQNQGRPAQIRFCIRQKRSAGQEHSELESPHWRRNLRKEAQIPEQHQ
jgi:hypothetical protein